MNFAVKKIIPILDGLVSGFDNNHMKNVLALICLLALVLISTTCSSPKKGNIACKDDQCWEDLIQAHLKRYPLLQIVDLYKLLYQSTLGNGHALTDSAEAQKWMNEDLKDLDKRPMEPLADTLGNCGRFARVHIKTYVEYGGNVQDLMKAFLETGQDYPPDSNAFFCAISTAYTMAQKGKLPWSDNSLQEFIDQQARLHYPAVDHSAVYDSIYRPAYRVIAIDLLPGLFKGNDTKVADLNSTVIASRGTENKKQNHPPGTKKSDS